MPRLIQELTGGTLSEASKYGGWLISTYAIMQSLCAPVVGALSDRYGRRPVLLASLLGFAADFMFMAFAPTLGWLFVGRLISGVMGASFTTAGAYIADVSPPEKRAQNFGLIGAAFGLGFIVGPVLGGLLGGMGTRVPFMVTAGLCLLNALYGFLVLPESLPPENRRPFTWKRANPLGTLRSLTRYPQLGGLLLALTLLYVASHAIQGNWSYYTMEKFKWTEKEVGMSLGVVGVFIGLVQGVFIRKIIPALGQQRSVYVGLALYACGFFMYAFATQGWMMYAISAIYCLGGIAGPAMQGIMSNAVPANEQGELQGGFTSVASLSAIVGPFLMNSVLFATFTRPGAMPYFPGAAMVCGGLLSLASAWLARRKLKKSGGQDGVGLKKMVAAKDKAEVG